MRAVVVFSALLSAHSIAAVESGPQGVVREFCQADALGKRVSAGGWPAIAPIVSWPFEPAWDGVALITGYTVGPPRAVEGGGLAMDVLYRVVGQVSAFGMDTNVYVETVPFHVDAPDVGWRITGPPPPPHVFATYVDVEALRRSLTFGTPNFVPNSVFVYRMFRAAGWDVPFQRTGDLLSGTVYRPVTKPRPGDVVVYLSDGVPYHAGLLEAEGQVVSSSLNAGIVRTPVDGFPGEVRYLRLIEPVPLPSAVQSIPTPVVTRPTVQPARATPTQTRTQPSARRRVEKSRKPGPRRTPTARAAVRR